MPEPALVGAFALVSSDLALSEQWICQSFCIGIAHGDLLYNNSGTIARSHDLSINRLARYSNDDRYRHNCHIDQTSVPCDTQYDKLAVLDSSGAGSWHLACRR